MSTHHTAGHRLDAVPIGKFHRRFILLICLGIFWDSFDNTLSASVLASLLPTGFSTLELNSIFLSVTFAGLAIGAAIAGWVSDRFGRAFAFQVSLGFFGVLALCASLAPSMEVLIVLRGVMAIGLGAEYVICYGMVVEFIPRIRRGRYLGIIGIAGGIGVSLSSIVGALVIPVWTWRGMFVIAGVGALTAWWLRRGMPESPRWLESRGRYQESEAILRKIENESGVTSTGTPSQQVSDNAEDKAEWVPIKVLFTRPIIRRTVMALVLTITCLFGSYAITGWMPTFFVAQGMSVTKSLGYSAAILSGYVVGPLLCVFLADRLGRRRSVVLFGVLAAIFAGIYPFMIDPVAVISVGFVLVAMAAAFLTMSLGSVPEFFPTAFRFRGGGFTQTVGRTFLIVSPFIILYLFTNFGIVGVILVVSGVYLAVSLLNLVVPVDTSAEALEHLVDEAEHVPLETRSKA
jgi:putative MFS transporter